MEERNLIKFKDYSELCNPFFIEEVLRSFIDAGALVMKEGNYEAVNVYPFMQTPASEFSYQKKQPDKNTTMRLFRVIQTCKDLGLKVILGDIKEMCKAGSSPDLHVGVEIDTHGEHTGSIRNEITERPYKGDAHR